MKVMNMESNNIEAVVSPGGTFRFFPNTPLDLLFIAAGGREILRVCPDGNLIFNREGHPDWEASEFAKEFMDLVELEWSKNHRN